MNHDLKDRIRRRAGRILREWVPLRIGYRPTGVHPSSKVLDSSPDAPATYHEIEPAHISYLPVSEAYQQASSVYEGSQHQKPHAEAVPSAFVLELPQGRLYADNWDSVAVIANDGKLVGDSSFRHNRKGWSMTPPEQNNIFQQRFFRPPLRLAGTVCSLLGGRGAAMGNYYHWLIDSLPRLHLVRAAGLLPSVNHYLIYCKKHRFAVEMLTTMGIRPEQIIEVETHPHILADRLLVTSPVRGTGNHMPIWAGAFLRDVFLPGPSISRSFSPYVYISRRDARMRQVLNEPEVEEVLHPLGFATYALSDLALAEQRALFSQARLVVSPIGAGLANLVFSPPGMPVLELMPRDFVMPEYVDIAARMGLAYHWMICDNPKKPGGIFDARQVDLIVDPVQLQTQVAALLVAHPAPAELALSCLYLLFMLFY